MPSAACGPNSRPSRTASTASRTSSRTTASSDKPYTVAIDIYVQGDEVVADYSRSSPQAKGPINATLGVATGAVYNGLLHITDPSIPKNSGCLPADPGAWRLRAG